MPNKMVNKVYYFLVLLFCFFENVRCTLLCQDGFCRDFRQQTGCLPPALYCGINNATHMGLWLPSPTMCNCCEFCLPFIVADNPCSVGGPGMGTTVGRCGNGLTCKRNEEGYSYCERMKTECHIAQDDFDARHARGQTGSLEERPICDGKGMFAAHTCVPTQTCFCQTLEGKRIFGEALYAGAVTKQNMHCGCSRLHDKINKLISPGVPYPVTGPRCAPDGNFHRIQCFGRTCHCVNPVTGVVLEGSRRQVDLERQSLKTLECYDPEEDQFPQQIEGSPPFNFTTPCLENLNERIELLRQSEEDGFNVDFASDIPGCLPDGTFSRISVIANRTKICVDERGRRIGDYEAAPDTPGYADMNCNCAYTSYLMKASPERPVCCKNGNFRRIQCRRGLCRCVDTDGRQTARELADPMGLPCFTFDWRTC